MKKELPNYLSNHLNIKVDKRPVKAKDRVSSVKAGLGIFIGYLFIVSGIFDLLSDKQANHQTAGLLQKSQGKPFSEAPTSIADSSFFQGNGLFYILTTIGIILIVSQVISFLRCRKIVIGNRFVTVFRRTITGDVTHFWEAIENYEGVRYRTRLFQSGIRHSLQHIIELAHKDESKTIPLYIGKKVRNVRKRWEIIARKLHMPAIVNTVNGTVVRAIEDLDKSIATQVKEKKLENSFDESSKPPKELNIKQNKKSKILSFRSYNWDFSSFLFAIVLCFSVISVSLILLNLDIAFAIDISEKINTKIVIEHIIFFLSLMIIIPFMMLFKKQKIEIKNHHIRNIYSWPLFRIRTKKIKFDNVEAVDVVTTNGGLSYYLAITSDDVTIHFGKKASLENLNWTRAFLINELSKVD